MTTNHPPTSHAAYRDSGVDTDEADIGLTRLIQRITRTWPPRGSLGGVQLPIGYFANVIDIGGIGLAICTDGVGSKVIGENGQRDAANVDHICKVADRQLHAAQT